MKMPYFKNAWDRTPCVVHITDGLTEGGVPQEVATYTGKCNFAEKVQIVRAADGTLVQLNASLTIGEDIAPAVPALNGSVDICGRSWNIATSGRPRNPDGTVNHTDLGLQ